MPNLRARDVQQAGQRGIALAARVGYLAHGVVYALMGSLALSSVLGRGERVTGGHGAVRRLGEQGSGDALVWAVAFGLACYALWKAVRALLDPEHVGRTGKALLLRAGWAVSAVSHGVLSVYAFQVAAGAARGEHGPPIAAVLGMPGGQVAIAAVGAGVICFGLYELLKAIKDVVGKEFVGSELPPSRRRWVVRMARMGHGARGVVFAIIGGSLITAAIRARASEAHDFGDALRELAGQPFGGVLLGIVAVGLLAYGVHMLFVARYGRISQAA